VPSWTLRPALFSFSQFLYLKFFPTVHKTELIRQSFLTSHPIFDFSPSFFMQATAAYVSTFFLSAHFLRSVPALLGGFTARRSSFFSFNRVVLIPCRHWSTGGFFDRTRSFDDSFGWLFFSHLFKSFRHKESLPFNRGSFYSN